MKLLIFGGYARSLINFRGPLIADLLAEGHAVVAVAPEIDDRTRAEVEKIGASVISVDFDRTGMNPWKDLQALRSLRNMMAKERPDIVLSYTIKPAIYGTWAARLAGIERRFAMFTGRGSALREVVSPSERVVATVIKRLCKVGLRGSAGVLFHNVDDQRFFLDSGLIERGIPTFVVDGSGVDLERFAPIPLPDVASFLMIARLLQDKGVHEYVEASRRIRANHPSAVCRLVGWIDEHPYGIREEELARWVEEGTVDFIGKVDDVRPVIGAGSVFVLPSRGPEGLPRSCLEAMAMGRAIITTNVPGCRETVDQGVNGLLVEPGSADELAAAMEHLAADASLRARMGAESLRIARERFDVRRVNGQMFEALGLTR